MKSMLRRNFPAVVFLVMQAPIAWTMRSATWAAQRNWNEVLGADRPLPFLTDVALRFGLGIPLVGACTALAFLVMHRHTQQVEQRLSWLVFAVTCEAVALGFYAKGLVEPAMYIQY